MRFRKYKIDGISKCTLALIAPKALRAQKRIGGLVGAKSPREAENTNMLLWATKGKRSEWGFLPIW